MGCSKNYSYNCVEQLTHNEYYLEALNEKVHAQTFLVWYMGTISNVILAGRSGRPVEPPPQGGRRRRRIGDDVRCLFVGGLLLGGRDRRGRLAPAPAVQHKVQTVRGETNARDNWIHVMLAIAFL